MLTGFFTAAALAIGHFSALGPATGLAAAVQAPFGRSGVPVSAFGARGDGRTDDSAAIQAAADSGRPVTFPAGTYYLGRPVAFRGAQPEFAPGASVSGPGTLIGLSQLRAEWFGVRADDSGRGDGTVQNANLARLAAAIGDGATVEFPDTGGRYIRISGAQANRAPLTVVAVLDVRDKRNVTIRGRNTRVFMSDFDARQAVDTSRPYYGGGIYFFVRLLRCDGCTVEGFSALGTFPLDSRYPPGARGALSRASVVHVQQSRRVKVRFNEARQIWGNLVNVQSVANASGWVPYEDVDVTDNFIADTAESAINYMGGGFRGLIARNRSVNCVNFAESASHGIRIEQNEVHSTWDNRHRQAAEDGGGPVAGAISVIGNDSIVDRNRIFADIGWIDETYFPGVHGYLLTTGIDVRNQGGARAPVPPWEGKRARITNNVVLGAYLNAVRVNAANDGARISGNYLVTQRDVSQGVRHAAAAAAVRNGRLASVAVGDPGGGYTYPPIVVLSGGGGSGAKARAVVQGGRIARIEVIDPGAGYESAPSAMIAGGARGATRIDASPALQYGIRIRGLATKRLSDVAVTGNQIFSTSFGIAADHVDGLEVSDNEVDAGEYGIYTAGQPSAVRLNANRIRARRAPVLQRPARP